MKLVSIVGARPQFIKAAVLSRELRKRHVEVLLHTGQHYDDDMSRVFFAELEIPEPEVNLGIGSGSHASQTAAMLAGIEKVLEKEMPDRVVVFGDTNSTLAGALAAAKLGIPTAHVEAGLRSFNRDMAEEINRVLTDRICDLLFCPSRTAVANLKSEGIEAGVHLTGDIMQDALLFARKKTKGSSAVLERLGLKEKRFLLATVHRAENTDDCGRLKSILSAFSAIDFPIVFPVHPRTHKMIVEFGLERLLAANVKILTPLGYLDMVALEGSARAILTDSGGVQKEAYWLKVPCVTLRDETEWVETVSSGWNTLAGIDPRRIASAVAAAALPSTPTDAYGRGGEAPRYIQLMENHRK